MHTIRYIDSGKPPKATGLDEGGFGLFPPQQVRSNTGTHNRVPSMRVMSPQFCSRFKSADKLVRITLSVIHNTPYKGQAIYIGA